MTRFSHPIVRVDDIKPMLFGTAARDAEESPAVEESWLYRTKSAVISRRAVVVLSLLLPSIKGHTD